MMMDDVEKQRKELEREKELLQQQRQQQQRLEKQKLEQQQKDMLEQQRLQKLQQQQSQPQGIYQQASPFVPHAQSPFHHYQPLQQHNREPGLKMPGPLFSPLRFPIAILTPSTFFSLF